MQIYVIASHTMHNAPPGYIVLRIDLAANVYVVAEQNPFTGYNRFGVMALYANSEFLGELKSYTSANCILEKILDQVSELYKQTFVVRSALTGDRLNV